MFRCLLIGMLWAISVTFGFAQDHRLKLLFLGDQRGHQPRVRFDILAPVFANRGIDLEYTEDMSRLSLDSLNKFDGLILYANIDNIDQDQAKALLNFVESGKGFVPLHCASYCFRNAPDVVALIGAQFKEHGTDVFTTRQSDSKHPVMNGFGGFTSWDETYVHHLHNEKDRIVLEYRYGGMQSNGNEREPWTWVRTHGKGRVFYTAWGHDERTWSKPGFHNLIERGVRWACSDDPLIAGTYREREPFQMPEMNEMAKDLKPFAYKNVGKKIPNYTPDANWGTQGELLSTMQEPLSPEESLKHYVSPKDFAVELFAAEPELGAKPISMTWDHRGRLWVCQTIDYPNSIREPGSGNDRITICEDLNGDGRADQFTLFADKLSIPTALVCYRDGLIVQDGIRTLFLKDTNGDDVADVREVLITGWNMGDTHGGVSNFRYGLDNWIWAMQGYNDSRPKFSAGEAGPFRMGFFRFKLNDQDPPQVTELEFVRSTDNNTWGLGITEEGLIFGSTANRNPSVFMPIANRYYERVRGWGPEQLRTIADTHLFKPITKNIRQVDHHGGYTAGAGHAIYTARSYPESWWNRIGLVNGPTGHLVGLFELVPDGAGFKSHSPGNLIASDDEWAAPIMSEVGPDGNIWTIDWYNYIVQHNPTPNGFQTGKGNAYETDLRDKIHGRVLRVVYQRQSDSSLSAIPSLSINNPSALVATLRHPNMLWRLQAQRLLVERGKTDIVGKLIELLNDRSVDPIGLNVGAIHALWTLDGLGLIRTTTDDVGLAVVAALDHPSPGVRRNAIQVIPKTESSLMALLQRHLISDSEPQVQLAAILALADLPKNESAGQSLYGIASSYKIRNEHWLADAVTSAAAIHAESFLKTFAKEIGPPSREVLSCVRRVTEHVARGHSAAGLDSLLKVVATSNPERVGPLLDGLLAGWPSNLNGKMSKQSEQDLVRLADRLPASELSQLITLASRLGSNAFDEYANKVAVSFRETLSNTGASTDARVEAAQRLVALLPNDEKTTDAIVGTINLQLDPETATRLLQSLSASRADGLPSKLLAHVSDWTPNVRKAALQLLLTRQDWTRELVNALSNGSANFNDLALDQRQSLANHPDATIREASLNLMKAGGGLPSANRIAIYEKYLPATQSKGDPARGALLFKELCSNCHRHGEVGLDIGPELTGMAVHPKADLMVHVLDPSRNVEGNFRAYTVLTTDGRTLTGMLAGESKTTIEIVDTTGKREILSREDIEDLRATTKSVMPEGFEQQLDLAKMADLLEFLTKREKFLPLDLRKAATLASDRPMFYGARGETMTFAEWGLKKFNGIPFSLINPSDGRVANAIMLHGPQGVVPPKLPERVQIDVGTNAKIIHILGGVGGWNAQRSTPIGPVVMTVRLHYADGKTEDHDLRDGVHFADYIGNFEVPESTKAFVLQNGYQLRYLALKPDRPLEKIEKLELIKADHPSSPITMAITLEGNE